MKLLRVEKSEKPEKKWKAIFEMDTGRTKTTHFGQRSAEDYTQHHDKERRERYRSRHKKDLNTGDFTRPGYLSWYLLWGDSTSFQQNLSSYRQRFGL
jgi:hypothetical protein